MAGAQDFKLWQIRVQDRPIYNWQGVQATTPDTNQIVLQWADLELASAWFARAKQLAKDAAAIRALDAGSDQANGLRQHQYVYAILDALANGYNALDIPWTSDPIARSIYRSYVSGPPTEIAGSSQQSEFGMGRNYADGDSTADGVGWYRPNAEMPQTRSQDAANRWGSGGNFGGVIPQRGVDLFRRLYRDRNAATKHPLQFRQRAGLFVDFGQGESRPAHYSPTNPPLVQNAKVVINRPFVVGLGIFGCGGAPRFAVINTAQNYDAAVPPTYSNNWFNCVGTPPRGISIQPDGVARSPHDWRTFTWDEAAAAVGEFDVTIPLAMATPLRDYLSWLSDWTERVTIRTPVQIILDARAYAAYMNVQQITIDGEDGYIGGLLGGDAGRLQQSRQAPPGYAVAATAAAALGAAFAGQTLGISALVGGAAALVITLVGNEVGGAVSGFRDDLGRYKPTAERGWLAGNPGDALSGRPEIEVLPPPNFARGGWQTAFVGASVVGSPLPPLAGTTPTRINTSTGSARGSHPADASRSAGASAVLQALLGIASGAGIVYATRRIISERTRRRAR